MIALAMGAAVLQVAMYYIAASVIRSDGALAIAQPDTLLYCQAARRIAEGFPFSFSVGTAMSTGTTSVVYPFVLAPLYWVGFKGASFVAAGFLLNALFYVIFILGWTFVALRAFSSRPHSRVVSVLLLSLFGPFAYCALAQSDIGIWMAVSAWLAYGLYVGSWRISIPLLLLSPWVRPEGMVVVASCSAVCAVRFLCGRRDWREIGVCAAALASVLCVFALNYLISGECQFSSVAQKGYFKNLNFASAAYNAADDFMRIVKSYLLGIPREVPRDFFFMPVVGAALMWIGFFARSWREVSWREIAWYLAMLGGIATVATSGWQNTNLDRYLVWIMPVLLLHIAYGSEVVAGRLASGAGRVVPGAVAVAFTAAMAFVFTCVFAVSSASADSVRSFAARCDAIMPAGSSVGVWGNSGVAYELSERRVAHVSGIYSPEFFTSKSASGRIETLRNEPQTRFDYWMCNAIEVKDRFNDKADVMAGALVFTAPPGWELRKADWSAYDDSVVAPKPPAAGLSLAARVDVAYEKDEVAAAYEPLTRDDYPLFAPFHCAGSLGKRTMVDGGRFLLGGDAMSVPLAPGRDVHVVMRTTLECKATVDREIGHARSSFSLKSPLRLHVSVDGADAGEVALDVPSGDFAEASFVIPGRFINSAAPRIVLEGEHAAFCYWFYQ